MTTELYEKYLKDQREDSCGGSCDPAYLDFLFEVLKPEGLKINKNTKVIDIGTRAFDSFFYFKEKYGVLPTGIDICNEAIQRWNSEQTRYKKYFIDLDAHELQTRFKEKSIDLVVAFHSFEHMFDLNKVLDNCYSVLKDNGFLYFAVPIPSENWGRGHWWDIPTLEYLIDLCKKHNFMKILYAKHVRTPIEDLEFFKGRTKTIRGEEGLLLVQK